MPLYQASMSGFSSPINKRPASPLATFDQASAHTVYQHLHLGAPALSSTYLAIVIKVLAMLNNLDTTITGSLVESL